MFISGSESETASLGAEYAANAGAGDVFALRGELGAGKTAFVKGFVAALGSNEPVTSPTFTLLHEYRGGRLPVYHFDFYRLNDRESLLQVGADDYFFGDGISVVEWADRFPDLIPRVAKWLSFTIQDETHRIITQDEK